METKTVNLEVKSNADSLKKQFKDAVAEVQKLSAEFGETSAQVAEAAKRAASLKDRIEDANDAIAAFKGEGAFLATGKAISSVASGFSAVQGAMGLMGVESEELEKTLLKVQSAMALSQGLAGLEDIGRSFKQVGVIAKNALAGIRTGIAATGIGLLVVALGAIVAYWDDIKSAVSGVSDEQTKLNEKTDANVLAQQAKYDAISGQDNILKLQGKSEQDILKIKKAQINAVITATEAQLVQQESTKKAQVAAAKRNNEILQGIITFLTAPLQLLLKTVDMVGSALGKDFGLQKGFTKGLANLVFDPEETAAEADKTIEETKKKLATLKNEAAGFEIALQKQSDKAAKTSKEKTETNNDLVGKANAQANKLALEQKQQLDAKLEEIAEQNYLKTLSDQEREERLVKDKYFELETLAKDNADALADLEIAKMNELNDINLKYQEIAYKQDQEAKAKQKAADEKAAEEKINTEKAVADARLAIQQQGLDTALQGINLIKGLFEKQKGVQKAALIAESAIGIAKMIISNKAANTATTLKYAALPGGVALAASEIAFNNISTGIGIAANIAATGKALKALGGGSVSPPPSTGGGGGSAGGQAPSFNVVGNSGVNQLAQLQQQPVQAYVVSGSVTTAQSLDRNRIENATL
jgi:hypothetical protein